MSEPEGPENWQRITLRELTQEAHCLGHNKIQKLNFVQEQQNRYDETWGIIEDLCKNSNGKMRIMNCGIFEDENTFIKFQGGDYTALDIDLLLKRVHKVMDQLEEKNTENKAS